MVKPFVMRKFLMVAMILAFVFVTAACGGGNNNPAAEDPKPNNTGENTPKDDPKPEDTPKADPGEKVKIRIATWVAADSAFKKIGDAFTALNPNIEVEIVFVNGSAEVIPTLTQAVAANDPIDLFWHDEFTTPIVQGFADDLTPFIDSDPDFKNYEFSPGRLEQFQFKGSQYALSRGNDAFLVYYNKDILNKYGLTAPSNDWTFEQMVDMAKKATNPAEKTWGFEGAGLINEFLGMVMPVANGHAAHSLMMNEDYTKFLGDDPAVLDDLQSVADFVQKDGTMLNDQGKEANGVAGVDLWSSGQALFTVHVSPLIPGWKESLKFNWDVAPYPAGTAKQVNMIFDNPMFLSKAGKNKEAAWKFMKFWAASVEGQKVLIDIGGTFPNSPNPEIVEHFKNAEIYKGLNTDALNYAASHGEIHATRVMIGANELNGFIATWAHGKAVSEGVSAHDYFPSGTEALNKKLQELQDKYK